MRIPVRSAGRVTEFRLVYRLQRPFCSFPGLVSPAAIRLTAPTNKRTNQLTNE